MYRFPLVGPPLGIPFGLNLASPQARTLLGWWPTVGMGGGNTIFNRASRAYNMALAGTYTNPYPAAVVGNAVKYNGSSGYAATTGPNPAAFTLTCWANFTSLSSNNCPVGNFGSGSDKGFWLNVTNTGVFYLWISTDGSAQSSIDSGATTLSTGTWYHLAATYNAGACAIYINGRQIATGSIGSAYHATTTANAFAIGRLGALSSDYANAAIADVRLYGSALSAYEIQAMYLPQTRWELYAPLIPISYYAAPSATIIDPGTSSTPRPLILRRRAIPKARTTLVYYSPQREPRGILTGIEGASYGLTADGTGGGLSIALSSTSNQRLVQDGGYVVAYRRLEGSVPRCEETYIVGSQPEAEGQRGTLFRDAEGDSVTRWLFGYEHSRVVPLIEAATGSFVTDTPADNAAKYFISRGMGKGAGNSGSTRGRDLSVWMGLSIAKDRSLGPSIDYEASLKPLSTILKDIAGLSELDKINPCRLFVYARPKTFLPYLTFEVVTFVGTLPSAAKPKRQRGARGAYRGFNSASPVYLGTMFGNVSEVDSEHDVRDAYTSVVVTYQSKTLVTRLTDTRRVGNFPANFRETIYHDNATSIEAEALVNARAALNDGRDRTVTRLVMAENENTIFERDFFIGDVVAVFLRNGRRFEAEVTGADITISPDGETITIRVEEIQPALLV